MTFSVRTAEYNDAVMKTSPHVARICIQLKTRSLERTYDYRVPDALAGTITAGSVVLVPLGRQKVLGIVSSMASAASVPESRLVDIEEVIDYPPVPEPLVKLALWISEYYYCSPAVALSLVLPPGGLPHLEKQVDGDTISYRLKAPAVRPRLIQFARLVAHMTDDGHTDAQNRVLALLDGGGQMPVAELCRQAEVSRSPVKSLADRGEVEIFDGTVHRDSTRFYGGFVDTGEDNVLELNQDQAEALDTIIERLDEPSAASRSKPVLLLGVAGAGKTEVYLRAIEAAVARGGAAIVLVPEISLTHQAVKRFRRLFRDRVGIIHSSLGIGERYDEYRRIRDGEVDVVIGPRSALFAPLSNLSLIVVDEENDSSFKQENDPRYDARRVALERARLEGAALVYGSATPSMESYHFVRDRFYLMERATGASMPDVEIVDMRRESDQVFSRRLVEELDSNMAAGGKAILLLNRRGYARYLQCGHCGYVWRCHNCDVSLTIHSRGHRLACHHCGHNQPEPDFCPECRSAELRRWGVGTERLESGVREMFPEAEVFRLDSDTAAGYGEGPRILERFSRADRAILLGTQMVAKGHHFPDVTLAAVINADLALQFPEFRAEEQTFALLQQLAGRSGRDQHHGRVLVQTWNADIECIRMAAGQATEEFYQRELDRRRMLGYPPFKQLINIACLSRQAGKEEQAIKFLKEKLEPVTDGEQILGPAGLFRVQSWSRSHILVKTDDTGMTLTAFRPVLEKYREPFRSRGVRLVVDVDPQWLS